MCAVSLDFVVFAVQSIVLTNVFVMGKKMLLIGFTYHTYPDVGVSWHKICQLSSTPTDAIS